MSKVSYQIVTMAVTWFILADQVRRQVTEAEDEQLAENVRRHGILQPLGARPNGRLCWGHRRLKAAVAAGLEEVPVVILPTDMTEGEYLTLQVLENEQRVDLSDHDRWLAYVQLIEAHPGWTQKDLANALGKHESTICRVLAPAKCSPAWQAALRDGRVLLGDCVTAARLPAAEQDGLLALRLGGATREQMESAARKRGGPKTDTPKLSRVRVVLPGGVVVTVAGPEMDTAGLADTLTAAREMAMKANRESLDIKTAERVWRDKAKAG